jgi:hypothetical protein
MVEYVITLRGKREEVIVAARVKEEVFWLTFLDEDNKEVAKFNRGDVESYFLLSARKGPSIA